MVSFQCKAQYSTLTQSNHKNSQNVSLHVWLLSVKISLTQLTHFSQAAFGSTRGNMHLDTNHFYFRCLCLSFHIHHFTCFVYFALFIRLEKKKNDKCTCVPKCHDTIVRCAHFKLIFFILSKCFFSAIFAG